MGFSFRAFALRCIISVSSWTFMLFSIAYGTITLVHGMAIHWQVAIFALVASAIWLVLRRRQLLRHKQNQRATFTSCVVFIYGPSII